MVASRVLAALSLLLTASRLPDTPAGHERPLETTTPPDSVWYWFATCDGPTMTLEVRLDDVRLYQVSFPICRAGRASSHRQGQAGRFSFWFEPRRAIVWTAYRDDPDTTRARQLVEGDVWQAGADPDDLVLGVSFIAPDRIMTNTTHIARPGVSDTAQIARGLVIITYPTRPLR